MTSAIAVKQSKAADTRYPFIQNVFYLVVRTPLFLTTEVRSPFQGLRSNVRTVLEHLG
jgi:hypothetical protein